MAVIHPGDPLMRDPDWRPDSLICFLCGVAIIDFIGEHKAPFIHWAGFSLSGVQHILLHQTCALELARYLDHDGHNT